MRYEKGHKDETHRRILDVAAKEFRKNGIASAGVASIMKGAGLTNGAFYAHFSSKEALVREVLGDVLDQRDKQAAEALENGATLVEFICQYLSPLHRDDCENGCPTAALLSELVHHSKSTKALFTEKITRTFSYMASQVSGNKDERFEVAISVFSMMLGALQLARAATDRSLSDQILRAASQTAIQLVAAKN